MEQFRFYLKLILPCKLRPISEYIKQLNVYTVCDILMVGLRCRCCKIASSGGTVGGRRGVGRRGWEGKGGGIGGTDRGGDQQFPGGDSSSVAGGQRR